ncbi:MAG: acyl-CoA dehydrogenase [Deltaproteobacteria bacterium]|nr:acyl-CoA dehydrogenase [Deltaproteobacteria bacterium]
MILLNPRKHDRNYPDERSREVMLKTIEFFESKGKRKLKEDDRERVWYADFLEFVKKERIFATILTPSGYGAADSRWDTWRICEFAEILGFYGLQYWYTWQVSVLGLGPIWMSGNAEQKQRAARLLEEGGIFAFGLSEKAHGADVYSTDMHLTPQGNGEYLARGEKYYIGNGNKAAMVSTFGKLTDSGDYVFFAVDSQHEKFECVKNVINSQSFVSDYVLHDYPVKESDILSRGQEAWNAALNTVNVGKFNLGWASIGICTHALYEAITHASNRKLYGMQVTDFDHVKQLFTDAYARLLAMKLVTLRAADYMRSASPDDRRYLLYNAVVKMKVTTQGEDVVNHLWDVIAAKGFEKDMYFEMAARDIRAMPKLEGTVHVNVALINKFMPGYFLNHQAYEEVPRRDDGADDSYLFRQGPTKGLGHVRFPDYAPVFEAHDLPNVNLFREQMGAFRELLEKATPGAGQANDVDFMLALGEIFVLVVYAQLLLENAKIYQVEPGVIDQIFDVLVRDFSKYALHLYSKPTSTPKQMEHCLAMIRKPIVDEERYRKVWEEHVHSLNGAYEMNP